MNRKILFYAFLVGVIFFLEAAYGDSPEPNRVSLATLIVTPDKYQAKPVQVSGYLQYEDGAAILYLSKEMGSNLVSENAIWLYLDTNDMKKAQVLSNKWVTVDGVFSAVDKGHWQAYAGSLKRIDSLVVNTQ